MKCIEAQRLVKPYLEKQLSDRELESFLEHIENCADCYDELEIYYSIYSTLDDRERKNDPDEYNFKKKLNQDLRVSKRYLHLRKAYRFFRFAVVVVAELLLVLTVITGIELLGEEGSRGTTLYRLMYGDQGVVLPVTPLTEPLPGSAPLADPRAAFETEKERTRAGAAANRETAKDRETAAGRETAKDRETAAGRETAKDRETAAGRGETEKEGSTE